jgi:hypothetical protein
MAHTRARDRHQWNLCHKMTTPFPPATGDRASRAEGWPVAGLARWDGGPVAGTAGRGGGNPVAVLGAFSHSVSRFGTIRAPMKNPLGFKTL